MGNTTGPDGLSGLIGLPNPRGSGEFILPGADSYVFNASPLTVTDATHAATIALPGSLRASDCFLHPDHHAGTSVTHR